MFHRIVQYETIGHAGQWYRPVAYGDPQADGTWHGWLVFFPAHGGPPVAAGVETTQPRLAALSAWASAVTRLHLDDALARALELQAPHSLIEQLGDAEDAARVDAERLAAAADAERAAAEIDEAAAAVAREEAERLQQERLRAASALAGAEEAAAKREAEAHEEAAREARAASKAAGRRRSALGSANRRSRTKRNREREA